MASDSVTVEVKVLDLPDIQQIIADYQADFQEEITKLKREIKLRCKCAISDCLQDAHDRNCIVAPLDDHAISTLQTPLVKIYLCDKHYSELVDIDREMN